MQASAGKYNIIVLGKDDVLRKAELIRGQQNLSEMSHRLSYYSEYNFDETGVATVTGNHSGQCILTLYDQGNYTYFHIDNYHTHKVIDAKVLRLPGESIFWMATLDISGFVVIRKFYSVSVPASSTTRFKMEIPPQIWNSPVPSPRRVTIINNKKLVFVFGRGFDSKSFGS